MKVLCLMKLFAEMLQNLQGFFWFKIRLNSYILYEVKNIWSFSKNDMYYSRASLKMIVENRLTQHDLYMMIAWVIENKKHLKCRKQNNF